MGRGKKKQPMSNEQFMRGIEKSVEQQRLVQQAECIPITKGKAIQSEDKNRVVFFGSEKISSFKEIDDYSSWSWRFIRRLCFLTAIL
jgi:hypothetical protein